MKVSQFISQKLGSFGVTITEADLFEALTDTGLNEDDEMTSDATKAVNLGLISFIPQILARPTHISEGGVSISWDRSGLMDYYRLLCRQYGIEDALTDEEKVRFY